MIILSIFLSQEVNVGLSFSLPINGGRSRNHALDTITAKNKNTRNHDTDPKENAGRQDVQELMGVLTQRYPSIPINEWTRTRNYLYRNAKALSKFQLQQLIEFLAANFDEETQILVLQSIPRILRKSIPTFLQPTTDFLRERFGEDLFREAVKRNPKLLMTTGIGYDAGVLDMVRICLRDELGMSKAAISKLSNRAPFVFDLSTSKMLSTIEFLRQVVRQTKDIDPVDVNRHVGKVITSHPEVLRLSVEDNLRPRLEYLQRRCHLEKEDLASFIQGSSSAILGLSIPANLDPTIDFLESRLHPEELRKCIMSHAQILGLSIENLESKAMFFDSIDFQRRSDKSSLTSRIFLRSPEVFSLSLSDNITPKVRFLARVWGMETHLDSLDDVAGVPGLQGEFLSSPSLSDMLKEDPSVLSLSLEGNLTPTVNFFNRTGYIRLDGDWRRMEDMDPSRPLPLLRARYLASSLFNRLLPRYHFYISREDLTGLTLPLYILVSSTDIGFCEHINVDLDEYKQFKIEAIPRLKFSSQFDTWLKTGRPIDSLSSAEP